MQIKSFFIFLFSIRNQFKFIKQIITTNGNILIIFLDPRIKFFKKKLNIKNIYILEQWLPGALTSNLQKNPDLVLYFHKKLNLELINELYLTNIPTIMFSPKKLNIQNVNKQVLYENIFKNSGNISFMYLILIFLIKYLNKE